MATVSITLSIFVHDGTVRLELYTTSEATECCEYTSTSTKPDTETSKTAARLILVINVIYWALGKLDRIGSDMGLVRAAQAVARKDFVTYPISRSSVSSPLTAHTDHTFTSRRP